MPTIIKAKKWEKRSVNSKNDREVEQTEVSAREKCYLTQISNEPLRIKLCCVAPPTSV